MKKHILLTLVPAFGLLAAIAVLPVSQAHAQRNNGSDVRWDRIVGVITAVNVDNPVSNINSGTFPWVAQGGGARVNLSTGAASFQVDGLVINGAIFSGTPGPVSAVTGTLVCNPGDETTEAVLDTAAVPLNQQGDARFSGHIANIPAICANPLFLVRIATPAGAAGLWIATGADRSIK
ncbi:MAG TPA: hypothetical protein VIF64_20585 [Pyrinomonadaceae bacterium]|jgi:hypothetical protein